MSQPIPPGDNDPGPHFLGSFGSRASSDGRPHLPDLTAAKPSYEFLGSFPDRQLVLAVRYDDRRDSGQPNPEVAALVDALQTLLDSTVRQPDVTRLTDAIRKLKTKGYRLSSTAERAPE